MNATVVILGRFFAPTYISTTTATVNLIALANIVKTATRVAPPTLAGWSDTGALVPISTSTLTLYVLVIRAMREQHNGTGIRLFTTIGMTSSQVGVMCPPMNVIIMGTRPLSAAAMEVIAPTVF